MEPQEALRILDQAAAGCMSNREGHQLIARATAALAQYIEQAQQRAEP